MCGVHKSETPSGRLHFAVKSYRRSVTANWMWWILIDHRLCTIASSLVTHSSQENPTGLTFLQPGRASVLDTIYDTVYVKKRFTALFRGCWMRLAISCWLLQLAWSNPQPHFTQLSFSHLLPIGFFSPEVEHAKEVANENSLQSSGPQ